MSTRGRSEFPFLEHFSDNITTFVRMEGIKKETKNNLTELMRIKSSTEEEFRWRVSKVKDSDLIDKDVDYVGVNREIREIVENPRYRPWLQAGQLATNYVEAKQSQLMHKFVAPCVTKAQTRIQKKTENVYIKMGTEIAFTILKRKLGL